MKDIKFKISLLAVALYFIFGVVYLVILLLPSSIWFRYYSVDVVSAHGRNIVFSSTYEKSRPATLFYNDILRCDFGQGEQRYSSNLSESLLNSFPKITVKWTYEGRVPTEKAVCRMDSIIKVQAPLGILKPTGIQSLPFTYTP